MLYLNIVNAVPHYSRNYSKLQLTRIEHACVPVLVNKAKKYCI